MSTPPSFNPQPIGAQGGLPPPAPPRYLKHQIYTDPVVFKHIDDHSINVSSILWLNLTVTAIFGKVVQMNKGFPPSESLFFTGMFSVTLDLRILP